MARQLTPTTVAALLSGIAVVAALGFLAFTFLVSTKVAAKPEAGRQFRTDIIATELDPSREDSVFLQTVPLTTPTDVTSGGVEYQANELGKSDITKGGQ